MMQPGARKKRVSSRAVVSVLVLTALAVLLFVFVSLFNLSAVDDTTTGTQPQTHYLRTPFFSSKPLSEKVNEWMQIAKDALKTSNGAVMTEFWTPVDISITSNDAMLHLCKLDFKSYHAQPHLYPMFKDLVAKSRCGGANSKRMLLSEALAEIDNGVGDPVVPPTAFIFHESRVGSTLVANMFASEPHSLVFSESTPPATVLLHCEGCTRARQVKLFQQIVTVMGRSPFHQNLFFKFQSATSPQMSIALEAFPDVRWGFVFRDSVQTMMSHLDPAKGGGSAVCLRSRARPPKKVIDLLEAVGSHPKTASREEYCAAHLASLCAAALDAYNTHSLDSRGEPRGLLIEYKALPGIIPRVLLPGKVAVTPSWVAKMREEADFYSKSRTSNRVFTGDAQQKEERAPTALRAAAERILDPLYHKLLDASASSIDALATSSVTMLRVSSPSGPTTFTAGRDDLKFLAAFPDEALVQETLQASKAIIKSATPAVPEKDASFAAWDPFAVSHSSVPFERVECPPIPAPDYPKGYPIANLTANWAIDETDIPARHYDSFCHIDFQADYQKALAYRDAEVPFIMYNIPELDAAVKKWSDLDYLNSRLGSKRYRTEASTSNHFMYWHGTRGGGKDWKPPTEIKQLDFETWLRTAVQNHNKSLINREHLYFRASDNDATWIRDDLPFFKPVESIFMKNPREQRGIHCRFGMRSVIAENHFDGSRNMVAMIGGLRRWIMSHPNQCGNMYLYQRGHPSSRHSEVDWSNPNLNQFPKFRDLLANEVILTPGDMLYVPAYWFHYIVSLNVNWQCNSRSGRSMMYRKDVAKCGF